MVTKKIILLLLLFFGGLSNISLAQQNTVSTGGDASNTSGSISFSIGQIDFINSNNTTGKINQGLQQPFEIYPLTGIENKGIQLTFSIYPNPTNDRLILSIENTDFSTLSYNIIDSKGTILFNQKINQEQTTIALSNYPNSNYTISINRDSKTLKSFNIIKNQ